MEETILFQKDLPFWLLYQQKRCIQKNLKQRAHKENKIKDEAALIAAQIADLKITLGAKTSSSGKIFGSVNTIQIAEALKEKGFDIDRKDITLPGDMVKEVGNYVATVKLHKEVKVDIQFEIIAE